MDQLGGNVFAASLALLKLLEKLRRAGAASGRPVPVSLLLKERQLTAKFGDSELTLIASLANPPAAERVAELRAFMENSIALIDPEILLQRNVEMMRHFNMARENAEKELEVLQQSLKRRQIELLEISRQAETDGLTGLLNRRAFDTRIKQVFLHTMRQKDSPLSRLFFDLDHFKEVNDKFGHQVGDEHLCKMADVLRNVIREDVDFAFRFGGDEFAVIIFADYPHACNKSRQVLEMMNNKVSIGITSINRSTPGDLTLQKFIRRADSALYQAKHRGRGQSIVDLCASQFNGECEFPCLEMAGESC